MLAGPERRIDRALRERAAVVADEKEQRIFPHAFLFQTRHDPERQRSVRTA